jgi:outer membrane protein
MKTSFLVGALLAASLLQVVAQEKEVKIGYADVDYILAQLPATKKIKEQLAAIEAQLTQQFELKQKEFNAKYKQLEEAEKNKTMLPVVRDNAIRELQMLEQNLMKFEEDARVSLEKKQTVLTEPIFMTVGNAIAEVAKENGFSFILNPKVSNMDVVLFADEKWDVSDLVLKKLNVTPKVAGN